MNVVDALGHYHSCRVVLDAGLQSNFISETFCSQLRLRRVSVDVPIKGVGETLSYIKASTNVIVESKNSAFKFNVRCLVIPRITDMLPSKPVNRKLLNIPSKIKLADPNFDQPAQVDMLIGAEHFYQLLSVGQIKLASGSIVLQKTRFGWVVSGRVDSLEPSSTVCHFSQSLEDSVQKFWEIEDLPVNKILSPEEEACENHYKQTVNRLPSGRYTVRLPFNKHKQMLGESYDIALRRLQRLEKGLAANPKVYDDYRSFLKEYEVLEHMTESQAANPQRGCFLPHHAVLKESSTTTKLRVVFDASAKTTTGISLNNVLCVGPVVQQNLFSIITRFRLHNIAFTADIEKMYRHVFVHEEDRPFQKIL